MADKRTTADAAVARLADGMTIGIGGWGSRRKPMALVHALLRSSLRDLTVVSFGGPDVGMLCAAGKVKKLVYGFVSLDSIPLEPHFRLARQRGAVEVVELDEGMLQWGLYAAALRLPFLPTRAGLGSDVLAHHPELRTVRSPYDDGEELVAMPALALDAALVHVHRADAAGNGQLLGPDPYFDDLYLGAAKLRLMSCEQLLPSTAWADAPLHTLRINRMMVDAVVEAPRGAGFTDCEPDYGRDEAAQRAYADSAASPEAWAAYHKSVIA
jgi:acyl CoA:acetate/3-ketoacid CoA transferase alpha subunit